ncbi:hypothetical protein FSOLCH5_000607 [Fusarium solani]
MSKKRTLDAFFSPVVKKPRNETNVNSEQTVEEATYSKHRHYPHPIKNLPTSISNELVTLPARPGREINDQPDLDLLYFEPFIPVFGIDETSKFNEKGEPIDASTGSRASDKRYDRYPPRPIPGCLNELRCRTEAATGCQYNFCLVNYYASGVDSISFHSDDEQFLGRDPAIASFSLGARRDFLMKHKPPRPDAPPQESNPLKLPLGSGDMVLMRGRTQSNWLHSIPKRTGKNEQDGGRINITFRRAMVKGGTENYYNYNVGTGPVYRWNGESREMLVWKP